MKILHLGKYFPPESGGMEIVLRNFCEATSGSLANYCLVASRSGGTRIERAGDVTVHYLKERGNLLLAPILPSLPWVVHLLRRRNDFSALVVHYPNPTAMMALLPTLMLLRKKEKLVIWHHADVILEERWKRALYAVIRPLEEFVIRRTDAFIAATPNHVSQSATFGRYRDRTAIIPYALPDGWFDVSPAELLAARAIREQMGGRYLLFVGRLVPYKGLGTLVRAADRIDARIAIIGTGPLEGALRKEIDARGLKDKALLLGKVDDVRAYYLGCEFLVLPSVSALEGFGVVQIEAMALGKPVVSSDLPTGVTYVNRNGETGLTFPVGDAEAFAAACNRLLEDEPLKRRLGSAARERTRREFSYGAMKERAVSFFRGICGEAET
jgi:rhamnosyl/mannosyltransferase